MLKCKKDYYIVLFSMIFIFCIAGSSSAVLRLAITDEVDFELGVTTIFIEGTDGGDDELAEVPFKIDFHDDAVPDGKISKLEVRINYEPTDLTFVTARPAVSIWGELTYGDDYTVTNPDGTGIIKLIIYPDADPYVDVTSGPMTLAYFEFTAKCQAQEIKNDLNFTSLDGIIIDSYVDVELNGGGRNSYTPELAYATDGSVWTEYYWTLYRIKSIEPRGALGTTINVPVQGWSNCLIDGVTFSIVYDQTKLHFVGVENWESYFPEGFESGTEPQEGDYPINISLNTGDGFAADMRSTYWEYEIFELKFDVINEWDGETATMQFIQPGQDPDHDVFIRIDQGGVGYCEELSNSIMGNSSSWHFGYGLVYIKEYAAGFESRLVDNTNRIWDIAGDDQTVAMTIKLCNNFNAGPYSWQQNDAITAVVDPPDILVRPYTGFLEQNDDIGAVFSCASDEFSFDTLAIYQYYNTLVTHDENALPISECGVPEEGGVDLVNLNFKLDDVDVTGFMGDDYALDFAPFVLTTGHTTHVEASDYQKTVPLNDGLDTTAISFKVATGEFSCDLETSTSWSVTQEYYVRNSFNLASFQVKVAVTSGSHYVNSVTPENGVDYIIAQNHKSVIFTSNGDWVPADDTAKYQFAEIQYSNTLPPPPAKAGPGDGCYWVYSNSTIAFQDAFMSDLTGDDPLDPTGNQPFLFLAPNNIRKATRRCPEDPLPQDFKATHAVIPTEYNLYQNYPNPFNPNTKFAYDLPEASHVRIEIFNILGQHVTTLVDETKSAGSYEIYWNATNDNGQRVSSGIYLYIMQAGEYSRSAKMTLMK